MRGRFVVVVVVVVVVGIGALHGLQASLEHHSRDNGRYQLG